MKFFIFIIHTGFSLRVAGYESGQFSKIGCFKDSTKDRDLKTYMGSFPTNSPSVCSELCSNYPYFGLQYRQECWCGTSHGKYGEDECTSSLTCPGDPLSL